MELKIVCQFTFKLQFFYISGKPEKTYSTTPITPTHVTSPTPSSPTPPTNVTSPPVPTNESTTTSSTSSSSTSTTSSTTTTVISASSSTTALTTTFKPCLDGQFQCLSDGSCIKAAYVCDGRPHCPRAEDEPENCTCTQDQFTCANGQCIPARFRCDKVSQCDDLSDEINCTNCEGFKCNSGLCLWTTSVQCNGYINCLDLSDEVNCMLRPGYMRCKNGLTIPNHKFCDHKDDCFDNSDETDEECDPYYDPLMCSNHERACADLSACYLHDWHCDGYTDCADQSDESNCGTCVSGEFQCGDYSCVQESHVCDGIKNCPGGEDELDCVHLSAGMTGVLTLTSSDLQLPVCSSQWNPSIATEVCMQLGQGSAYSSNFLSLASAGFTAKSGVMSLINTRPLARNETVLSRFTQMSSCETGTVLKINCQPKGCGEKQIETLTPFIVGGNLASRGEWPWVVSLVKQGTNICGGAILGTRWRVRVNKIFINPRTLKLENGQMDWDMALLELRTPLVFGDYVQPICLPAQMAPNPTHQQCYLAGWGYINVQGVSVVDLRDAKMQLYTDEECSKNTVSIESRVNTNSTMCAGYGHGQISGCQGDSGSPLMCQDNSGHWSVQGLMSYGTDGCDGRSKFLFNRFAKVSTSVDWLHRSEYFRMLTAFVF
ncbi:CORIN-like protein [Mya arenaria]|uniref:CORIN-like protein n=1 Tax=Mya arenaria TaxID=6604 RepID=A0ABY7DK04_MYAAR|nr:CORIN-like protein [Mya arenaria]